MKRNRSWFSGGQVPALVVVAGAALLFCGSGDRAAPLSGTKESPDAACGQSGSIRACADILAAVRDDSSLAAWMVVLARPGDTLSISLAELAASALCLEGPGGFTTTAGKVVSGTWSGISLPDLLVGWAGLDEDHSLTFAAEDGYRMAFSGSEILDRSQGTWILAVLRDGVPLTPAMGLVRAIKVGSSNPMVTAHLSVQRLSRISIAGVPSQPYVLAMRGAMQADVDRQTLQSCVSCHGVQVSTEPDGDSAEYTGVPLYRLLSFSDDSLYAPHRQDSAIRSYQRKLALAGYGVEVSCVEGRTVSFDSRALDGQDRVVLVLYRDGEDLADDVAPALVVATDADATPALSPVFLPRVRTVTLRLQ